MPDPRAAARTIVFDWRRLTSVAADGLRVGSGAPTVVACSGGADSSALAFGLADATDDILIAHVVHDMRHHHEAAADAKRAEELALRLGRPFVRRDVAVSDTGSNLEAAARAARYRTLADIAIEAGIDFVATAHHASDQLETLLMALARGAGLNGLSGIRETRVLDNSETGNGVTVVRPMLNVTRADAEAICSHHEWSWAEDATNTDERRLRAYVRHNITPLLDTMRPGAALRAARSAQLIAQAADLLDEKVRAVSGEAVLEGERAEWKALSRTILHAEKPIVIGQLLRERAMQLTGGVGADAIGSTQLGPIIRAIRSDSTEPRSFDLSGLRIHVTAKTITIERTQD